jgi:HEPN domain-containing protein
MELHDQWLEKATRDIRTASLLLESDESLLDMVVYHAQQCA